MRRGFKRSDIQQLLRLFMIFIFTYAYAVVFACATEHVMTKDNAHFLYSCVFKGTRCGAPLYDYEHYLMEDNKLETGVWPGTF